jgi:hypothetical protein
MLLVPLAAAAVVGTVWGAIRFFPFDGIVPVVIAALAGMAILALPMPKIARIAVGLVFGIAVRFVAYKSLAGPPDIADTPLNLLLSAHVLAGQGLTIDLDGYGPHIRGMYPPVYILALAATQAMGGIALQLNIVADLAASAALYRLSSGNEKVAIAYFLFPSVVLASLVPLKEELAVALMLIAMCSVRRPLLFGALAGLIALTQPAWTPVPLVAFLILERRTKAIALALLAAIAVLLPWWVRNALVFHHFVPLTTSAGFSLWVAVFGTYRTATTVPMNEVAMSWETGRAALAAIGADPAAYLHRIVTTAAHNFALNSEMSYFVSRDRAPWVASSANVADAAWAALLVWSAAKRADVDRRWLAFAAGWSVAIFLGLWMEFGQRHRAFAVPLLLLWICAQPRMRPLSLLLSNAALTRRQAHVG